MSRFSRREKEIKAAAAAAKSDKKSTRGKCPVCGASWAGMSARQQSNHLERCLE